MHLAKPNHNTFYGVTSLSFLTEEIFCCRIFLIKQSGWISLTIWSLNLSVLVFVNLGQVDEARECLIAFPCALTVSFLPHICHGKGK